MCRSPECQYRSGLMLFAARDLPEPVFCFSGKWCISLAYIQRLPRRSNVQIGERMGKIRDYVLAHGVGLPAPHPGCVLFFSVSDGRKRATVMTFSGTDVSDAWKKGANRLLLMHKQKKFQGKWLRVDWVDSVEMMDWKTFSERLGACRRNYFRYGLTLDSGFRHALLELECNGNGIFYGSDANDSGEFNADRFTEYCKARFDTEFPLPFAESRMVGIFSTAGVFCDPQGVIHPLPGADDASILPPVPRPQASSGSDSALWTGRRYVPELSKTVLDQIITGGSRFLAGQIKEDGEFIYGYLAANGTRLNSYNVIRHAGTLLSLLDTLEYNGDESLRPAIAAGIQAMATSLARRYTLPGGEQAAFMVDRNGEIKLGGNGVALVVVSRWVKLTGNREYLPFMEELAAGIEFMRSPETGAFVHVLNSSDLSVKAAQRVVYYDGEALFGLMQLYSVTKGERWLDLARSVFEVFIRNEHWDNHDHWLSYAANEISEHLPEDRYFLFGLRNVGGYLNFILKRETTYPTLLELCMAAEKMIRRLEAMPEKRHLLEEIDLPKFRLASKRRAEYLLNGYFWEEMAMFFQRPERIVDSFFIRHHRFRVRIDDVAHYLCGLAAYAGLFFPEETN